jgi:hypothetical protein
MLSSTTGMTMTDELTPPPLPIITDPELISAVSALAGAAHAYRSVLFKILGDMFEAKDKDSIESHPATLTLMEHEEMLTMSDLVINAWRDQLALDEDA